MRIGKLFKKLYSEGKSNDTLDNSFNGEKNELMKELTKWCQDVAFKKDIPPYFVLQKKVLINIVNQLPKTKKELIEIKGIGKKRIESYGEEILKIVNNPRSFNMSGEGNPGLDEESQKQIKTSEPQKTEILTVEELTKYLKNLLESDGKLNNLLVRGEISNLTHHGSGHTYFSLKDKESQIKCVLFKWNKEGLGFDIEHGMKVIVGGSVEVYKPKGEYSIIVKDVQPDGLGSLNLAFNQLKEKLKKEGLFLDEHKKLLPLFPKTIGIITSSTGAALQDILNIIKKRYPLVEILIIPTLMQGKNATGSIVKSIKLMNEFSYVDVIILGRGGGSLEDLWCFNEEAVAREIFDSRIPIISAVGHETDFTIADFVADYRAPTPSAAAERVVPDIQELYGTLKNLYVRNVQAIKHLVETYRLDLNQILSRPLFKRPLDRIYAQHKELGHISYELHTNILNNVNSKRKQLEIIESKLSALNPKSILKRGYSIIMKDKKIVKVSSSVKISDNIDIILHEGKLNAQIKKIQKN
ncbi:MAG: exodeoxyribonuclease VII large subunit [Nanoarchaeota archaeon]|nr:exodeoxyribonuclease VII large subunit [Nanoarchaeota archaeon]